MFCGMIDSLFPLSAQAIGTRYVEITKGIEYDNISYGTIGRKQTLLNIRKQ